MNGVFTEKRNLSYNNMFEQMISLIYKYCNKGIAFNVMSKQVDWEIDTLFHVPLDDMANFLTKRVSRNFIIRNDCMNIQFIYISRVTCNGLKKV